MKRLLIFLALPLVLASAGSRAVGFAATDFYPGCDASTTESAICQDKNKPETNENNSFYGKDSVLIKVSRLIAIAVGVASVIMIIVGGIKFTMASGDPSNVKSAKDTVIFALVGLIIAIIAASIIQFVLNQL